ncbi:hypothetical protein PA25_02150 [Pseudoalteromonas sp. A25]|uniref:hypothetical protein n=1 Tax=Pseudoalteromonas sp. A25 TaxID=116092 RepID=UPI0012A39192|nr:hypothetical protein [Pseudoalteromonas sp. A25]BBN80230.1 hypothetical protein PA25_02150 [Pseudoalteromonas sp. A25]
MHRVYQDKLAAFTMTLKQFLMIITLTAGTSALAKDITPEKLYDFDHKVHYEQTKYNNGHYLLQVKSDSYEHFLQQSVFLLRHSAKLCQGRNPQLTILKGIQHFDRLPSTPRPYQSDLHVEVKCVNK